MQIVNRRLLLKYILTGILYFFLKVDTLLAQEKKLFKKEIYIKNDALVTIKYGYKGIKFVDEKFDPKYSTPFKSFFLILKWKFSRNPKAEIKQRDNYVLRVKKNKSFPHTKDDFIMWLGHASFIIRVNGKNIITDPCLTSPPMVKRLSSLPLKISNLHIHYLLVSHGHYDHLDSDTIENLPAASRIHAFVPLKMGNLIQSWNKKIKIQEGGWYQKYNTGNNIEIFLLPSYHWHRRGIYDYNSILWGSYIIKSGGKTIYFAGDSGYHSHFKEIGKIFPHIDYAILPIGAYEPVYIMKDNHLNPQEAIQAFHDLKAKTLIPMHYGTFDLTDEPMGEPIRWFDRLVKEGKVHGKTQKMDVGAILPI